MWQAEFRFAVSLERSDARDTPNDSSSETAEGRRSVARWLRGGSAGSSQRDARTPPVAVRCSAIVSHYCVQIGVPRRETWNAMQTRGVKSERNRVGIEEVALHD